MPRLKGAYLFRGGGETNLDAGVDSSPTCRELPLPQLHQLKLLRTIKKRHEL